MRIDDKPFMVSPKPGEPPTWMNRIGNGSYLFGAYFKKKQPAEKYQDVHGGDILKVDLLGKIWRVAWEIDKSGRRK